MFLCTSAAAIAIAVILIPGAIAVNNTGAFELEGNAVTSHTGTGAPDDWDRVCYQVAKDDGATDAQATAKCFGVGDTATPTGTNGATATAWTDAADNPEIFTGGGSKDHSDPQDSWLWKPADTVPDKDTILHAFASRYSLTPNSSTCPVPTGVTKCDVIFFGSDRFANDGDSQLGFWFTQNRVSTTTTSSSGGFKFAGHHKNGDLLVISDFSNGGTTSTIRAYFWDTSCGSDHTAANKIYSNPAVNQCADSNLRLKAQSTNANCATSASTANFCGIVNKTEQISPWSYLDKTGHSKFQQGEFYEAGVNLSGLGIGTECFSSVIAESRASDSVGSVLKDLVAQDFGECTSGATTTPQADTGSGYENIDTAGVSIGTDARLAVRDKAALTVSNATTFGGTIDYYLCGPAATLGSTTNCATGGVKVSTVTVSGAGNYFSDAGTPTTLTSAGHYCWRAEYSGDSSVGVPASKDPAKSIADGGTTSECFKVNPVQPTLSTLAGDDVVLGNDITDTATLSGTANQPGTDGVGPGNTINATAATQDPADGSITWSVAGPDNCTDSGLTVTGSPATVSGDDDYLASATPTAIGEYTFIATYDGSSPNTLGTDPSACPNTDEAVSVTGTAGLSTAQDWLPNDTATLTGDSNLNGTLTFTLYDDGTCGQDSGTVVYTKTTTVTDAASGSTFSTNNTTHKVDASSSSNWSWLVSYDDNSLDDPSDTCESTSITITDG